MHQVSPVLYRSAQPTADGMKKLSQLGIKTIVSLRAHHSDQELIKGLGFKYENIKIDTWKLADEDVVNFLKLALAPSNQPVLVHCQHGADRTGTMAAMYRIVAQGWTKEKAIAEMTQGGFGYHPVWTNLINYIQKADIEKIRKAADITSSP